MAEIKKDIAEYNENLDFTIVFKSPGIKEIYEGYIIEEKLHKALTFNMKDSSIKANGELIIGNFKYDDDTKDLRIEIENPSNEDNVEITIIISTKITNLAAIVESNYIVENLGCIKIKGYENIEGLVTKLNSVQIQFNSVKLAIIADSISKIVPDVEGEDIILQAEINTLDTNAPYDLLISNNIGENLEFNKSKSYASVCGEKLEYVEFILKDNVVNISIPNSSFIRNKKIIIIIYTTIKNSMNIGDILVNEFTLSINNIISSKDIIEIHMIKPVAVINNSISLENQNP